MTNAAIRRKIILLVVVVGLAAPWEATAAGLRLESPRTEPVVLELANRLWNFLQRSLGKEGCNIDPSGRCVPQSPAPTTKEGCNIDPDGRRCTP